MPEVSLKGVLYGIAAVAAGVAFGLALPWLLIRHLDIDAAGAARARPPQVSGPSPQSAPLDDLSQYRKEKAARLESYGPVEGAPGRVHIPIERAMRMLAK